MAASSPSIAALKRQRTKQLAQLGGRVYYLRKRGRDQEMYDIMCDTFVSLGGVYVKFLQGVLLNTPVMKRWHSPAKLRIFENLDTEPMDIIQILRDELSAEQLQQIALIQPKPFAAGSFGQVYLGQHQNGKQIIIKVLRPMIRELLKYDLRLLGLFSKRFAAKEYRNFTVKMDDAIKEFRAATLSETDYIAEAQFASELFEAYKYNPQVVIPETYLDLCTPHIIVQDYLEGISGVELLQIKQTGGDPAAYVREKLGSDLDTQLMIFGVEGMVGAFDLPRVQGDPHPGNLRFLRDNKVGMIDFGISAPAPRNRAAFFGLLKQWHLMYHDGSVGQLFEQFMRFFVNDLYRALKKISALLPQNMITQAAHTQVSNHIVQPAKEKGPDLMRDVGHVVQNLFDSATGTRDVKEILSDGRMLQSFGQMVNKGNRLGLVVHLESSEILRAAQTYIAFLEAMGRRSDLLPHILAEAVGRIERDHADIVHQGDDQPSMSQAIGIVNRWLERIAVRDPALFRQLFSRIHPAEKLAGVPGPSQTHSVQSTEPINEESSDGNG